MAESTPGVFSLFYKSTKFCCYCQCTQIKVDPLQIRLILVLSAAEYYRLFSLLSGITASERTSVQMVKEAAFDAKFRFRVQY